jgi:hypothetical protein
MELSELPLRIQRKVRVVDGCWQWIGYIDRHGYGKIFVTKGRTALTHRFVYQLCNGAIPEGLQLDHLCRNRACFNPEHLEPVTCGENLRRGWAARGGPPACKNGHEYDEANTYTSPTGRRDCRICIRERVQRYRAKQMTA